ncbi:TetR family transcriptional regulator [Streptomyces sp. 130]|uniref:TetR/AcrR family transcriptional regulator n=1 Tax=Streptomyces sp. 130 TaxID=2591006 RepID=UPI001180AA57|nr:TetR/AcrR family transcriptional regulator [Streptomyces sp. 130]TRV80967.1 TetR family transcriptional regulator [Streptomyces sp. 130]
MPDASSAAPTPMGRRERKKAATRQAIADAALRLFLERGYDDVGIREIADAADVSTTTLFKHFTGKEALVFDRQEEMKAHQLDAVRNRPKGQSVPGALREHALRHRLLVPGTDPEVNAFLGLVTGTPALLDHQHNAWLENTAPLAQVISEESGLPSDDPAGTALARFALEAPRIARDQPDSTAALNAAFDLLEHGWQSIAPSSTTAERGEHIDARP